MVSSIPCVSWGLVLKLAAEAPPERERPTTSKSASATTSTATTADLADRIRAYMLRVPISISGKGGHNAAFYAAGRLVRGWGLSPDEALPFAAEWNQRCDPPWSEADLYRKLVEADKQPGIRGELRAGALDEYATSAQPASDLSLSPRVITTLRNYRMCEVQQGQTMRAVKQPRRIQEILGELEMVTSGWPKVCDGVLFIEGKNHEVRWLKNQQDLFAWIALAVGGVDWIGQGDCVNKGEFYEHCRANCESWLSVESYPHYPPLPGVFYIHPKLPEPTGEKIHELLRFFNPATEIDGDLIYAFVLTLFWGGLAGYRPVFIFEASAESKKAGRGSGKSKVSQLISKLTGSGLSFSQDERPEEVQRRLLSPKGRRARVCLMDNIKTLTYSNAFLEGLLTADVISGRQMFTGEGSRPNFLTWAMTFNQPSLSEDMADRGIIIRIKSSEYTVEWTKKVENFVEEHRWQIISDAIGALQGKNYAPQEGKLAPQDEVQSRWAYWMRDIVGLMANYEEIQRVCVARSASVNDSNDLRDDILELITNAISSHFNGDPDKLHVRIPNTVFWEKVVSKIYHKPNGDTRGGLKWFWSVWSQSDTRIQKAMWHGVARDSNVRGVIWKGGNATDNPVNWDDF